MKIADFKNLDKKSKIELAITSVAVIILIIVSTNGMKTMLRAKNAPEVSLIIEPALIKEMLKHNIVNLPQLGEVGDRDIKANEKIGEEAMPWDRDPFVPWDVMGGFDIAVLDIKLEGIIWDEKSPTAVINGGIYQKGDSIKNIKILQIKKQSIIVNDGNKEYNIELR